MPTTSAIELSSNVPEYKKAYAGLLDGYRFRVCEDVESFASALEVRREVYVGDFGYDVPVPDEYDDRSWLLIAETVPDGEVIGTMRITPRTYGPVESEEYFRLPSSFSARKVVEISRFAIRRDHRKTHASVPSVSLGLFKLCHDFSLAIGAECELICSKAERLSTYELMGFRPTGVRTRYEKLNGAEHELLCHDFRTGAIAIKDEWLGRFLCDVRFDEVVVPAGEPPIGLAVPTFDEPLPLAAAATAGAGA